MTDQGDVPTTNQTTRAVAEIKLLLEEYRSLRAEVLQRVGSRMTLTAFITASIAIVVSIKHQASWVYALAGGLLAVMLVVIWVWSWCCIERLSARLVVLEENLNDRARVAYGTEVVLFDWERLTRIGRESLRWYKPRTWC